MGVLNKYRRIAAMLALAGMAVYAAFVPGHVVSQATASAMGAAGMGAAGMAVAGQASAAHGCHEDMAQADDPAAPNAPTTPKKKCPFCTGYAAFLAALMAGADAGFLNAALASPDIADTGAGLVHPIALLPQNRGPPVEL